MANKRRATASSWKNKADKQGKDLELPSGNVALVRAVGMQDLLAGNIIPDQLSPIVEESIRNKKGLPPGKLQSVLSDTKGINSMFQMVDRIATVAILEPILLMPPTCDACHHYYNDDPEHVAFDAGSPGHRYAETRDPDALYADEISMEDKLFVFNYAVGGTGDLERFRQQHAKSVAGLSAGEDVEPETK